MADKAQDIFEREFRAMLKTHLSETYIEGVKLGLQLSVDTIDRVVNDSGVDWHPMQVHALTGVRDALKAIDPTALAPEVEGPNRPDNVVAFPGGGN
jgi:hypothetical protein